MINFDYRGWTAAKMRWCNARNSVGRNSAPRGSDLERVSDREVHRCKQNHNSRLRENVLALSIHLFSFLNRNNCSLIYCGVDAGTAGRILKLIVPPLVDLCAREAHIPSGGIVLLENENHQRPIFTRDRPIMDRLPNIKGIFRRTATDDDFLIERDARGPDVRVNRDNSNERHGKETK